MSVSQNRSPATAPRTSDTKCSDSSSDSTFTSPRSSSLADTCHHSQVDDGDCSFLHTVGLERCIDLPVVEVEEEAGRHPCALGKHQQLIRELPRLEQRVAIATRPEQQLVPRERRDDEQQRPVGSLRTAERFERRTQVLTVVGAEAFVLDEHVADRLVQRDDPVQHESKVKCVEELGVDVVCDGRQKLAYRVFGTKRRHGGKGRCAPSNELSPNDTHVEFACGEFREPRAKELAVLVIELGNDGLCRGGSSGEVADAVALEPGRLPGPRKSCVQRSLEEALCIEAPVDSPS